MSCGLVYLGLVDVFEFFLEVWWDFLGFWSCWGFEGSSGGFGFVFWLFCFVGVGFYVISFVMDGVVWSVFVCWGYMCFMEGGLGFEYKFLWFLVNIVGICMFGFLLVVFVVYGGMEV